MDIPLAVSKQLRAMLPASYANEITSFAFVPDFPDWPGKPDLIATTKLGELVELRDRRVIETCPFLSNKQPKRIALHYGNKFAGIPSYIVTCEGEVLIFAKVDSELRVVKKFTDVSKLVVDDVNSTGESSIRMWMHDEAIPTVLDNDTFEVLADDNFASEEMFSQDDEKLASLLRNKLSEARLNTAKNQKIYEERRRFRQKISHVVAEDARYEIDDVTSNTELTRFDKLLVGNVWQRVTNGKWIVGFIIENLTDRSIENLELLLKSEDSIFTYDTKVYTSDDTTPPFWLLKRREDLVGKMVVTMVAVSHLPTFELCSRMKLNAAVRYKFEEKTYCIPLPMIELKASDIVNSKMDPILNTEQFDRIDLLAVLCTSLSVRLDIHYVTVSPVKLVDVLIESLKFSGRFNNLHRVLCHAISPLNILHGAIVYIVKEADNTNSNMDKIVVLAMNEPQLIMFVNLMYELIPVRCVIVPAESNVKFKKGILNTCANENESEDMDIYSLEMKDNDSLSKFRLNLYQQMSEVSQYLEKCMEAMSELNINTASNKNDTMSINVAALGNNAYEELWLKLKQFMVSQTEILEEIL